MQKTVLLSIKPEYADKIFRGQKRYEYRRTLYSDRSVNRVVVYASSPVSQVVGEFRVDGTISMSMHALWKRTRGAAGVTWKVFSEYFHGKDHCHAIEVCDPRLYDTPMSLKEAFGIERPPQSFFYVGELKCNR
jgi:predicted transcriptional regulator